MHIMAINIKNAFNTLRWETIIKKVVERKFPSKIVKLLRDYLRNRVIVISAKKGEVKREIYAGVPQGSVIGSLLWNLVYDGLINKFDNLTNVKVVAFADDLAILMAMNRKKR
jgi:hypothetical protein